MKYQTKLKKDHFKHNFNCKECPHRLKCVLTGKHKEVMNLYKSVFANIYIEQILYNNGDKFAAGIKFERKRRIIWSKIPREGYTKANKKIKKVVSLLRYCTFKKS